MIDRLVFLHGFTQTHHHWHPCAHLIGARLVARLGGEPTLAFVDLPGHGISAADRSSIEDAAAPLAQACGGGVWIGYSLGGRFALAATVATVTGHSAPRPDALVLLGVHPGLRDIAERAERCRADGVRADRIEAIGVEAFVSEWLDMALFDQLPRDPRDRELRRRNTADGLASSLRLAGTGRQRPLWEDLAQLELPVLVLAGERDARFAAIGSELARHLQHGEFRTVDGAGHAAHLERPEATSELIADWLEHRVGSSAG